MIPNPILKVLSTLTTHGVRFLLMGGQACVLYGAAEFSRDTDIVLIPDSANLSLLKEALDDLQAEVIAVPPFEVDYLHRGMAIHFRCHHPEAEDIRLDIMAVLRGVDPFEVLWSRRTSMEWEGGLQLDILALPDLVKAKKTQRSKDWPMIRRLVEANYEHNQTSPTGEQIAFWLREARTADLLTTLARQYPAQLTAIAQERPLLNQITGATLDTIEQALSVEEQLERQADRQYWEPLKKELEQLRHRI